MAVTERSGETGGSDRVAASPSPADPLRRTGPGSGARRQAMLVNGLAEVPAEALAAELQRRGWVVMEP